MSTALVIRSHLTPLLFLEEDCSLCIEIKDPLRLGVDPRLQQLTHMVAEICQFDQNMLVK